jgi:pimeloyl-ACP methyl ester carboxylesterase
MIRKRYVGGGYGQVHLRENDPAHGMPIACLHATAYSSRSFEALLTALDGRRHAVAFDTPGYGESDPPPAPVTIADYAGALVSALPEQCDLFGYHSGVSIAVEIAIRYPDRIGGLYLMGIPYFRALDFNDWRERLTARHALGAELEQFAERWDYLVTGRPDGLSLRRGFENFVDELKSWPDGWWVHEALFAHDLDARLPLVRQPVTVINPTGHLAEPSRQAAALIADARVVEFEGPGGATLERDADRIAELILSANAAGSHRRRNVPETVL